MARFYFYKKWEKPKNSTADSVWREKYFSGTNFKKNFSSILFFSLGLALSSNADVALVKNIAAGQIAGYYAALGVLGKIILWLNLAIISVLFPVACSDGYAGKPASKRAILGSYGLIIFISLPIIAAYYFFPDFFVKILFGQKYLVFASNLWLFGIMAFWLSLLTLESNLALARQEFKSSLVLFASVILMAAGVVSARSDLRAIIIYISGAFFVSWGLMLFLNLSHRYRFVPKEDNLQL